MLEYNGWKGHKHFGEPIVSGFWGEFLYGIPYMMHPRDALRELKRRGYVIIIWTTRSNVEDVAEVLRKYDIPFDYIDENPYQPPDCSNKIYADVYIDDRAVKFWR